MIPEPEDGAYVLVGEPGLQVVLVRDDVGIVSAGPRRWWPVGDDGGGPYTWKQVVETDPEGVSDDLPAGLDRSRVVRLWTDDEYRAAVDACRVEQIDHHRVTQEHYCQTCVEPRRKAAVDG